MKSLQLKNAILNSTEIVFLRKKGNITIKVADIRNINYEKPTLLNYLFASVWFGGTFPGRLEIHLLRKVGKTKLYLVRIKYKDFLKLPNVYRKIIDPAY